ncbi:MAG: DUF1549 domain-containing protein [Planctomycetaceae bacterium]
MSNAMTTQIQRRQLPIVSMLVGAALLCSCGVASADDAKPAERDFTLKVLPLLKEKCLGCHGGDPDDIQAQFSVVDRQRLLKGGESGEPAVVPGRSGEGSLLPAIRWETLEMPPKENDRLTPDQIALVERWINAGAPWPDDETQARYRTEARSQAVTDDGIRMTSSGGTSQEWTDRRYQPDDLWAFQPVRELTKEELRVLIDEVHAPDANSRSSASGQQASIVNRQSPSIIDALILRSLRTAGIRPAARADARTLIRRATWDLHGLPPTPEDVDEFVAAETHDHNAAWSALVDRLLASPRYGEHWARHWLDVTRYADTGGMSNDFERSNMWRYRDYVIRAFNDDKPYDRFIIEQLAGDELADESVRRRTGGAESVVHQTQISGDYTPEEAEWIVASGFLRLGPWDNAMVTAEEARQLWLDDLVNITGQTFLSTTMRCVKCHDHKFDPIPTRDYYRMYAAFATTHMAERSVPFLPRENGAGFDSGRAHARRMLDFAVTEKNRLVEKREAAALKWFQEHNLPYTDEAARKDLPDEEKPPRAVGLDYIDEGQLKVREQDEWIWTRRLERYEPMAQSVYNAPAANLAWNAARKLRIARAKNAPPPQSHILTGGALTAVGDQVSPGVLSAVPVTADSTANDPYLLTTDIDGRRLGLAAGSPIRPTR